MSSLESPADLAALQLRIGSVVAEYNARPTAEPVPKWILPPTSCAFLSELAQLLPAGSTGFEFGSGRSTHVLRWTLAGVTSIEDSTDWLRETEKLENGVALRPADHTAVIPLSKCWDRLRLIESFDVPSSAEGMQRLQSARLVLVDSPPNPAKREHALHTALKHTATGTIIVIDDLDVPATARFTLRLSRQNAKTFSFWLLKVDHRLGIFLKLQSRVRIRSIPGTREFIGTWLRA